MFGGIVIRLCICLFYGLSSLASELLSVKEGKTFTLYTDVNPNQTDIRIKWYFNDMRIAQINGVNNGKTCTDDPCKEKFSDRLKLHQQTGSLTITNTRTTDSGDYKLMITANGSNRERIFSVSVNCGADGLDEVSVKEGDSVTLHADVRADSDRNVWYYNDIRIAQINRGLSRICADDLCKVRFGDRLKVDHQTASLTIMNIRETDAGSYKLTKRDSDKIFSVVVCGVSAAQIDKVKKKSVMEGESVTLDPGVINIPNNSTWSFNEIVIAVITGDLTHTCTGDLCKERFQERLSLNQNGSLTIMNTRTTDSGDYQLKINEFRSSSSIERIQRFSVTVTSSGYDWSAAVTFSIIAAVVVLLLVSVMIIFIVRGKRKQRDKGEYSSVNGNLNNRTDNETNADTLELNNMA